MVSHVPGIVVFRKLQNDAREDRLCHISERSRDLAIARSRDLVISRSCEIAISRSLGDVTEPVFASIVLKFTEDDYTWL